MLGCVGFYEQRRGFPQGRKKAGEFGLPGPGESRRFDVGDDVLGDECLGGEAFRLTDEDFDEVGSFREDPTRENATGFESDGDDGVDSAHGVFLGVGRGSIASPVFQYSEARRFPQGSVGESLGEFLPGERVIDPVQYE